MKRKLLPLLIAGLTMGNAAFAAGPTVYGKVNLSLNSNDFESFSSGAESNTDNWKLVSNASRIGIKGDLDISTTLKAVYKLEYETSIDDDSTNLKHRNVYAGLQSKSLGTLIGGRHDTPLKLAQESVDVFNDYYLGDMKNVMVGENRLNNIIMYSTPDLAGFALTIGVAPGEGSGNNDGTSSDAQHDDDDNGFADKTSIAVSYKMDKLYLAAAHDKNIEKTDITRLVAQLGVGPVTLGALWQSAERTEDYDSIGKLSSDGGFDFIPTTSPSGFKEQDAWLVSAAWKLNDEWVVKGQYVQSESTPTNAAIGDTEATMYTLGVDWKLSKASTVFAYYSTIDTDADFTIAGTDSATDKTFGVGYELKF